MIDLGADVPPEKFIEAIREKGAQIVCLSALLTVTMPSMKTTIEALKQAGLREQVKVLVGGAPVTQQYADDIGADGYGESASNAVALARKMCGGEIGGQHPDGKLILSSRSRGPASACRWRRTWS